MCNRIRINISGETSCGKTTVAQLIAQKLSEYDIKYEIEEGLPVKFLVNRTQSLIDKNTIVQITTTNHIRHYPNDLRSNEVIG